MQIVIDIPKQTYLNAKADMLCGADSIVKAIKSGIPLPRGHGRLIDADKLWDSYHNLDYDFYEALDLADAIIEAESEG